MPETSKQQTVVNITIFASGGGSNAREILKHFAGSDKGRVVLICSNNPKAGVFNIAREHAISAKLLSPKEYKDGDSLIQLLNSVDTELVILAGYLKLIPESLVEAFPGRIINIHPALLPEFGGKGMYGMRVHQAVIDSEETESGITIHSIDEHYDKGRIIFQKSLEIGPYWTAEKLQKEVLKLEHEYFPKIIEKLCETIQKQHN